MKNKAVIYDENAFPDILDYHAIGRRINKYRKGLGYSQAQLSEAVGVSTTHFSHIETWSTKLSLPVLVKIAAVLSVRTDDLLYEPQEFTRNMLLDNLLSELSGYSSDELLFASDLLPGAISSYRKYHG